MPKLSPAPTLHRVLSDLGTTVPVWQRWFNAVFERLDDTAEISYIQKTIAFSDLSSAASFTIQAAGPVTDSWKVREVFLSGDGTNFNAGGDRLINIQDTSGTIIFTVIPEATLESLAAARWGDTGTPYPATASDLFAGSTAGENIIAKYSGGATDYTSGSLTITVLLEKVA